MTEQTTTNPDVVIGTSDNDQITASTDVRAGDGNDSVQINPTYGNTQVITAEGESGHDTLTSESNSAVHLKGGAGNDNLSVNTGAGEGNPYAPTTVLEGGTGNDVIHTTGTGSSILFKVGDGQDRLELDVNWQPHFNDFIEFGAGITLSDLRLMKFTDSADLEIHVLQNGLTTGDSLKIVAAPGGSIADYALQFNGGYRANISDISEVIVGTSQADNITTSGHTLAGAGDDTIHINTVLGNTEVVVADGESGNDTLTAESASAIHLKGGTGEDTLIASHSPEASNPYAPRTVLEGGTGNDLIQTSGAGSIILFSRGDGNDRIEIGNNYYPDTSDVIQFGDGITADDLRLVEPAGGGQQVLQILQNGELSGDSLIIAGQYGPAECTLSFSDGSQINFSDLKVYYQGTEGNDHITANAQYQETVKAAGGDDHIEVFIDPEHTEAFVVDGEAGNDTLEGQSFTAAVLKGGDGNDEIRVGNGYMPHLTDQSTTLEGGAGDDLIQTSGAGSTILFSRGDGNDRIEIGNNYYPDTSDVIQFGDGITADDLRLVEPAGGGQQVLQILQNGELSGDSLIIAGQYGPAECTLSFSDGSQINFSDLKVYYQGTEGNDHITANAQYQETVKAAGGDDHIEVFIDPEHTEAFVVDGEAGNDTLEGQSFTAAVLKGGDGNDEIRVGNGYMPHLTDQSTTLEGGAGDDLIQTSGAGSTILFSRGDGNDRIEIGNNYYPDTSDVIQFGDGITADDLRLVEPAGGGQQVLQILQNGELSGDSLIIAGQYGPAECTLSFSDGSQINFSDLKVYYQGTEGNDHITANAQYQETVKAAGGDDHIEVFIDLTEAFVVDGEAGNDTLEGQSFTAAVLKGGDGNDEIRVGNGYMPHLTDQSTTLEGGAGDDLIQTSGAGSTILFSRGDGNDRLEIGNNYYPDTSDVIQFGDGITADDLRLVESTNGGEQVLQILENGQWTGDSLTIIDMNYGGQPGVIKLAFSDGSEMMSNEVATDLIGTANDDNLSVNDQYANVQAGDGNDTVQASVSETATDTLIVEGEAGNDTLSVQSFRNAVLKGGEGDDTLITLNSGLAPHIPDQPFTTVEGGIGNDLIQTRGEGTHIVFNRGDGQDTIEILAPSSSDIRDTVQFGEGISASDLRMVTQADTGEQILQILENGIWTGDSLTLTEMHSGGQPTEVKLAFSDGSEMMSNEVATDLIGTANDDNLSVNDQYASVKAGDGNDTVQASVSETATDTLIVEGEAGNDTLSVQSFRNAVLKGGEGDDTLITLNSGLAPHIPDQPFTTVEGGIGNDLIQTRGEGTHIVFNRGDGQDTIEILAPSSSDIRDTVQFGEGISASDLRMVTQADTGEQILQILENGIWTGDSLTLTEMHSGGQPTEVKLAFSDGSEMMSNEVATDLIGTANDDNLSVNDQYANVQAGDGNDTVQASVSETATDTLIVEGEAGNDTLSVQSFRNAVLKGGEGDDTLITLNSGLAPHIPDQPFTTVEGGIGNDLIQTRGEGTHIVFNRGDGQDTIEILAPSSSDIRDTVQFGEGISASDLRMVTQADTGEQILQILENGIWTGDSLTLTEMHSGGQPTEVKLAFSDGSEMMSNEVATDLIGTANDDNLSVNDQYASVKAGDGNDTVQASVSETATDTLIVEGEAGNDTLSVQSFRNAVLKGGEGDDTLITLNSGLAPHIPDQPFTTVEGGIGNDLIQTRGEGTHIVFNRGDGQDTIEILAPSSSDIRDTVQFGEGISASDLRMVTQADTGEQILQILENGIWTGDSLTLTEMHSGGQPTEVKLAFSDGSEMMSNEVATDLIGTANDDNLSVNDQYANVQAGDGNDTVQASVSETATDTLIVEGEAGNDTLSVQSFRNAVLKGGEGDDTLITLNSGLAPHIPDQPFTTVEGGIGNDLIQTRGEGTHIVFNRGDGQDTIEILAPSSSDIRDTVQFGEGISASDLRMVTQADTGEQILQILENGIWTGDSLTLTEMHSGGQPTEVKLAFSDGSEMMSNEVATDLIGTANDDNLSVNDQYASVKAGDGNDTVQASVSETATDTLIVEGEAGNDTLSVQSFRNAVLKGGEGDDTLITLNSGLAPHIPDQPFTTVEGGIGNDLIQTRGEGTHIVFNRGDGQDTIEILAPSSSDIRDTVQFGEGISASDLRMVTQADTGEQILQILENGIWTGDSLTLTEMHSGGQPTEVKLAFSDGSEMMSNEVATDLIGTANDDNLSVNDQYASVKAGDGNDTVQASVSETATDTLIVEGEAGNDTLSVQSFRNAVLKGGEGDDTLITLNSGLAPHIPDQPFTTVEGGIGNDLIQTRGEGTHIVFNRGDGQDTIEILAPSSSDIRDTVQFGEGISASDLRMVTQADTGEQILQILENGIWTGDSLTLTEMHSGGQPTEVKLAFSDGSEMMSNEVATDLIGTANDDNLSVNDQYANVQAGDGNDTVQASVSETATDTLIVEGEAGNDTLSVQSFRNAVLKGGEGDDTLITLNSGLAPHIPDQPFTTVEGGIGNDLIQTRGEGTHIVFNRGDGQDTIEILAPSSSDIRDTVQFGEGISASDLRMVTQADTGEQILQILENGIWTGDSLTLTEMHSGGQPTEVKLAFSDGSEMMSNEVATDLIGTANDDNLSVNDQYASVKAGDGNDTVQASVSETATDTLIVEGEAGNDTLSVQSFRNAVLKGGEGDDTLITLNSGLAPHIPDQPFTTVEGGIGNDLIQTRGEGTHIVFNRGDGQDTIEILAPSSSDIRDTVQFGEGISASDLRMVTQADTGEQILQILENGIWTGDSLTLTEMHSGGQPTEVKLAFSDGSEMMSNEVATDLIGTANDDNLSVNDQYASVKAGDGNDTVQASVSETATDTLIVEGEAGNDTLSVQSFRNAVLKGGEGDDTLITLNSGLAPHIPDQPFTTVEGGIGNDLIQTRGEGTHIVFNRGDGQDTIEILAPSSSDIRDTVQFGEGISASDLRMVTQADTGEQILQILENGIWTGDSLTLTEMHSGGQPTEVKLAFSDGSEMMSNEVATDLIGTANDDNLSVNDQYASVKAGDGNDTVQASVSETATDTLIVEGEAGNDTLSVQSFRNAVLKGGEGDDTLITLNSGLAPHIPDQPFTTVEGGIGNDLIQTRGEGTHIVFNRGDGQDTIEILAPSSSDIRDTVQFGEGISASDLRMVTQADTGEQILQILENGIWTGDSLTLTEMHSGGQPTEVKLAFSDGSEMMSNEVATDLIGTANDDNLSINDQYASVKAGDGNDTINANINPEASETLIVEGEAGNDNLSAYNFRNVVLKGGAGDDTINTNSFGYLPHITDQPFTTVEGGIGNDLIQTSGAGTHIIFNRGDGEDRIEMMTPSSSLERMDTVQFGEGISVSDLRIVAQSDTGEQVLQILENGEPTGDTLTIIDMYYGDQPGVIKLTFSDGSEMMSNEVATDLIGTANDDNLSVNDQYASVKAGDGNDTINANINPEASETLIVEGEAGNDNLSAYNFRNVVLKGGAGDDTINTNSFGYLPHITDQPFTTVEGGIGNDLIQTTGSGSIITFNQGDGQDRLEIGSNGVSGKDDVIKFGQGISLSDLSFQAGQDLDITFNNSTDQITVADIMSVNPSVQVEFADGSTHNLFDLWVI